MTLPQGQGNKRLSAVQLNRQDLTVHEFILSKDPTAVDVQIAQICALIPLHPLTIEDCRKGNQRSKFEFYPDYLFFVLHHFELDLDQQSELHVVVGNDNILLIADQLPPEGHETWRSYLNLRQPLSLADALLNIFDACVDSAEQRMSRLADIVSKFEGMILEERFNPSLILSLKQRSLRFQRAAGGGFTLVKEFISMAELNVEQELQYRNIIDHQDRLKHDLEFFHVELVALFDVYWGATSFHTNEQMKRLTLLATLIVPLGFWTSFFGMNFETMPFKETWFFYLGLLVMSGSVAAVFFYLKRRGLLRRGRISRDKTFHQLLK